MRKKNKSDDIPLINIVSECFGYNASKNVLGDVFIHLPGYPPQIASKLDSIFLAELFHAKDRKELGNRQTFSPVIRELQDLERNGLTINLPGRTENVYFCPCLYTGDNKGMNEDLGFVPHFHFGRSCRICRATVEEMKTMTYEIESLLRTRENYESDCRAKNPSETGVIEQCCFNEWDNYHAIDNAVSDLMHDEFEGTASSLLTSVCHDFIYKDELFDLDYLNSRIELYNKNTSPISNEIPTIKKNHMSGKNTLKMSSAEMINFTRSFGLIVGEKIRDIEDESETWHIYITYREIIDILLSPRIVEGQFSKLGILIPEFLSSYIKRYGHLKYKFHLMVHIIRILRKFGPMIHYWAMRMESKQRELKAAATCSSNTKNLLKTISLKSQLKLAYFKAIGSLRLPEIEVDAEDVIDTRSRKLFFPDVPMNVDIISTSQLTSRGTEFTTGMMCVLEVGDDDLLNFGLIREIFVVQQEVFINFQPHTKIYFDKTVSSHYVEARQAHIIKNVKDLPDIHPCSVTNIDDSVYVMPKYIL
ncbi:hypothetical protein QAD02_008264 [Eretmocerus hayati]|uniref:Uncharacterized protein n=1 Tax=Eretmocerus hayati TaxID=131215 RepID=A0ACC2N620_9HYME|nr:hypothetical protein QAD02_008264 [Eretmocerus hayati]